MVMDKLCTIIALNYLPQAMTLLQSARNIYPQISITILVTDLDEEFDFSSLLPNVDIMHPYELAISSQQLTNMRNYYDTMEFATSLKPFLLMKLLDSETNTVTYLDPDTLLLSEISEGMELARLKGIALTPHRLTPSTLNSKDFSELKFLKYGVFNLGYISVGTKAEKMLLWWSARLLCYSSKFPNEPVFTDQKWIDFVPALFEFGLVSHKGYNIAPWNLDERKLELINGDIYADGQNLRFIHFSGLSTALARGHKISEDFPGIFITMAQNYSCSLQANAKLVRKSSVPNSKTSQNLSYHYRQRLLNNVRNNLEFKLVTRTELKKKFILSQSLSLIFEKSAALNGLRDGLSVDLAKLAKKIRNFVTDF